MKLTPIVKSLLPHDYREQVLGDIQERGFRLRDVASVLPRVWWSCLLRAAAGPSSPFSASPAAILARTEQLQRQGRITQVLLFTLFLYAFAIDLSTGAARLGFIVAGLVILMLRARFTRVGPQPVLSLDPSQYKLLADYRAQIDFQRASLTWVPLFALFVLFVPFRSPMILTASWPVVFLYGVASAILVVWSRSRVSQLRRELESVETAQRTA